jgi:hypothetical protein
MVLLNNSIVLALDQHGTHEFETTHDGALIAWRSSLSHGREALAVFNTGDAPLRVQRNFAEFDSQLGTKYWKTRDAWAEQDLGRRRSVDTLLAPHACQLLLLQPMPVPLPPVKLPPILHK